MIRQTLRDLPVGLVQTYERIMLKINQSPLPKQEIALRAFRWTVCSRRPMKAEELQEAVAFDSSDMSWDRDKIPDENLMIETCRGLLVRDKEDRTVRFAHHTVQQYLLSAPEIRSREVSRLLVSSRSEAEAYIGQVCVTYLHFSDFETQVALRTPNVHFEPLGVLKAGGAVSIPAVLGIGKSLLEIPYRLLRGKSHTAPLDIDYSKYLTPNTQKRSQTPSNLIDKYRLLEYIVEYWIYHTQELESTLDAKLRHLVMHKTLSFEFRPWGSNQHFGPYGCVSCPDPTKAKHLPFVSLFHYAARVGHWSLMEDLVADYCQHEHPFNETLLIACRQGQDRIVQGLMRKITHDFSDGRAVNVAAAAGHGTVLKRILDTKDGRGASSYGLNANASSLLNSAATNGHENVVDIIFNSCDLAIAGYINELDEHTGRTALFSAVMNGHENTIRKLLARGAALMAHGNTALHVAAEYGHQGILRMLLELGAKDYVVDGHAHTHEFAYEGGTKGTYPQSMLYFFDGKGDTPLHKAATEGHSAVVKLIVKDFGLAGCNSPNKEGCRALHLAARGGHLEVLKILVDSGASVEATSPYWASYPRWTAFQFAAAEGHAAVLEWLLKNGANPDVDSQSCTRALNFAVSGGHEGLVRALLNFERDKSGSRSLDVEMVGLIETAAKGGHTAVVHELLDFIDVLNDNEFKSILRAALDSHIVFDLLSPLRRRREDSAPPSPDSVSSG